LLVSWYTSLCKAQQRRRELGKKQASAKKN
jgi:hypothetical protein